MDDKIAVRNPRTGKIDYWIAPPTGDRLTEMCSGLRFVSSRLATGWFSQAH